MTQLLHRSRPRGDRREDAVKVVAGVALGPAVAGAALVAVVVLVLLLVGGGDFDSAAAVSSALWLAAHQVPLRLDGQPLGVLPLLPTLVLTLATARSVRAGIRQSGWTGDRVLLLGAAAVAGPVLMSLLAVTLLAGRPSLLPVDGVGPGPALAAVVLVHGAGAVLGVAGPSGRWQRWRSGLPVWGTRAIDLAPRAAAVLLGGGALLLTASLLVGFGTVGSLYGPGASLGTVLGLTLVSVLYLPNAVVAAASVAVGPGVEIGRGSVTAVGVVGGPVPPLPLLGGMPGSSTSWAWLLVLLVPAVTGVVLGRGAARRAASATEAARTVLAAAAAVGVGLAVAGWFAGGRLGSGLFDPVHVPAGLLGVLAAVWLAGVGCATSTLLMRDDIRAGRAAGARESDEPATPPPTRRAPVEGTEPEPGDETEDDAELEPEAVDEPEPVDEAEPEAESDDEPVDDEQGESDAVAGPQPEGTGSTGSAAPSSGSARPAD